jgi:hypothetical protein
LWHGFVFDPDLPEADDAVAAIAGVFDRRMGRNA